MAKNVYIGASKQFSVTNLLDYNALSGNDGGYWGQYTFGTRYVVWSAAAPTGGHHSLLFNQNFSTGTAEATYQLTIKTGYIKVHLIPSHKYYFSVYLRQPSVVGSFDCYWPIAEPPVLQGVTVTAANTWQKKSTIVDRASFSEGDYEIRVDFNNPTTGSTLYVSNLVLVDLTATFGAGGEPDQAWCDANLDFNDTASDSAADTATITATGSVARRAKNIYIGVGGKARKVKKAYIGVGGKARLFYQSGLPPTIVDLWDSPYKFTQIRCVAYGNGYWVVGGEYQTGKKSSIARIAYTKQLDGQWTIKDLWKAEHDEYNTILQIKYANGYWVLGGIFGNDTRSNASVTKARIGYATSPGGVWNFTDLWNGHGYYNDYPDISCITYTNGNWIICGISDDKENTSYVATNFKLAYATTPTGSWTVRTIKSTNVGRRENGIRDIIYADGRYVAAYNDNNSNYSYWRIAFSKSLDGEWETRQVARGNNGTTFIGGLAYGNGYWVMVGGGPCTIAYATSPDGSWTTGDAYENDHSYSNYLTDVTFQDGKFAVCGSYYDDSNQLCYARVAYTNNPTNTWTIKNLWTSNDDFYNNAQLIRIVHSICYSVENDSWAIGGQHIDASAKSYARIAYASELEDFDNI